MEGHFYPIRNDAPLGLLTSNNHWDKVAKWFLSGFPLTKWSERSFRAEHVKLSLHKSDIRRTPDPPAPTLVSGPADGKMLACQSCMNRAFTLIELLVVIAIIAVLAALLLPALSGAKNRAQTATDLNNIHQILLAGHLYANDNNDFLPQPGEWQGNPLYSPVCVPGWINGCPFPVPSDRGGDRNTYDTFYPQQLE